MQKRHDERAKLIAEQALDRLGEVQREVEISAIEALRFDLSLTRRPLLEALPGYLTLLAVLFDCDCMIEVFSRAVSPIDFWDSQLKQLAWRRQMQRQVKEQPGPTPVVLPTRLWIISTGRPDALLAQCEVRQRDGLPPGVYEVGRRLNIGLIVVSELPVVRETLLLRLMGSVAVCRQAIKELRGLPDQDPDAAELLRLLAYLRHTLSRATDVSDVEHEEMMTATWAEFERYEQELVRRAEEKGEEKGEKKGEKKALCEAIVDMCGLLGIEISAERRAQLETLDLDRMRVLKDHLVRTRTWAL